MYSAALGSKRWASATKASVKIGFVKFIVAFQRIGFIEDRHHHRIIRFKEICFDYDELD